MTTQDDAHTLSGVTEALAAHAIGARYDAHARRVAMQAFLDTIPVMIAGLPEPDAQPILAYGRQRSGTGSSAILGVGTGRDATTAAFVNGTLAHLLDFDDVTYAVKGHPSAVLVPALLAGSADEGTGDGGTSGHSVLDAFLAAFDVGVAMARGFDIEAHYRQGWHATSTIGVIEAAAAVGRLIGLDLSAMRHAIGMAASFACGSKQNFGTSTKSLHVGHAARAGLEAAWLAHEGATADPAQLDGPLGYFALFGGPRDPAAVSASLDAGPAVRRDFGLILKKYPCCYHAHRAADAAITLHHQLDGASIGQVTVSVDPGGISSLVYPVPETPLQAKFSGPYIVATALLDGAVSFASFTPDAFKRADVHALRERVRFIEEAVPPIGPATWPSRYAVVRVETTDGRVLDERVDSTRGDIPNPLSDEDRYDKLFDCLRHAGLEHHAEVLSADVHALLDDAPATKLLDAIASDDRKGSTA